MQNRLVISVLRDDEAGVWIATSDDVPGLVTEAKTLDDLHQRALAVAPELLRDNGVTRDRVEIEFRITSRSPN